MQAALRQRAWAMVRYLAARRDAEDALIDRVLGYIDAGIRESQPAREKSQEPDDDPQLKALNAQLSALNAGWKQAKYLDADCAGIVRMSWWRCCVNGSRSTAPMPIGDGHSRCCWPSEAELPEAVSLFERLQEEDHLSAADVRTLADWYLVEDRRAEYERSRVETFKQMDEHQIASVLRQQAQLINNGGAPHELDENSLFRLTGPVREDIVPVESLLRAAGTLHRHARFPTVGADPGIGSGPDTTAGIRRTKPT